MKRITLCLWIFILVFSTSCDKIRKCNTEIILSNNSNDTIFSAIVVPGSTSGVLHCSLDGFLLAPGEGHSIRPAKNCIEDLYQEDHVFMYYFVHADDYTENPVYYDCDSIESNYNILKKVEISRNELENIGWKVGYP